MSDAHWEVDGSDPGLALALELIRNPHISAGDYVSYYLGVFGDETDYLRPMQLACKIASESLTRMMPVLGEKGILEATKHLLALAELNVEVGDLVMDMLRP